ncbi:MAG: class II fructose-bisphosphate aldolase [Patescibacteria group bacterium]
MQPLLQRIKEAEAEKIAIGHFNIGSLEHLKAIARAARALNLPVIIGVSEGEREYFGIHHVRDLIASYNAEHAKHSPSGRGFRLYLNADHTHSIEKVKEAVRLGFDEVLFDASSRSFDENVSLTRAAVTAAKRMTPEVLVEGELGYIGNGSTVLKEAPKGAAVRPEDFTTPEEAARFVEETGVDLLAPAVGNLHGMLAGASNPRLDIPRIRAIREAAGVPLILHGGSGIADEDFTAAIEAGVSVIHISTELRVAWRKGMERVLREHPDEIAPPKVLPEVIEEIERTVTARLKLFTGL